MTAPNCRLRAATLDDVALLAGVVIELDGEPVRRLRIIRDGQRVELAGIQLHADVQGQGIGSAIIETLKSDAANAGLPFELSVEHDNPRARALYERLGLVEISHDNKEARLRWRAPPRQA